MIILARRAQALVEELLSLHALDPGLLGIAARPARASVLVPFSTQKRSKSVLVERLPVRSRDCRGEKKKTNKNRGMMKQGIDSHALHQDQVLRFGSVLTDHLTELLAGETAVVEFPKMRNHRNTPQSQLL